MSPNITLHSLALLLTGLLTPLPALWRLSDLLQQAAIDQTPLEGVPLWIYLLCWVAILETAYAVYLLQLPDWTSLAISAGLLVLLAGLFAVLLGLTMFADSQNQVLLLLELAPDAARSRETVSAASTWCMVLVCTTSLLALWFGQDAAERRRQKSGSEIRVINPGHKSGQKAGGGKMTATFPADGTDSDRTAPVF